MNPPTPFLSRATWYLAAAALLLVPWSLAMAGYAAAVLSLVGWVCVVFRRGSKGFDPALRWALAWGGCGVLYALLYVTHLSGLEEIRRLEAPSRLLALSGVVFVPLAFSWTWRPFLPVLALAGVCFGLITWFHPPAAGGRHYGYYTYENMMGFASMGNALLLAAGAVACTGRVRWIAWLGVAGSLTAVALSGTRGAWLGALVLAYLLWRSLHHRPEHAAGVSHWRLKTVFIVAVGVTLWAASTPIKNRLVSVSEDFQLMEQGNYISSIGMRLVMVEDALKMIKAHPWQGNGLSGFHQKMQQWADQRGLPPNAPERGFQNPHNQYLHWAQSLGLPCAALCILGLLVLPLVIGRRARGEARIALLAVAGTTPVFLLTEAILDRHHGAQWFGLVYGLAVGMALVSWRDGLKGLDPKNQ